MYHPDHDPATPGYWVEGPDFPDSSPGQPLKANDAPGCVLPNGHVLCVAGTAPNNGGFAVNGQFFEFDGKLLDPAPGARQRGRRGVHRPDAAAAHRPGAVQRG